MSPSASLGTVSQSKGLSKRPPPPTFAAADQPPREPPPKELLGNAEREIMLQSLKPIALLMLALGTFLSFRLALGRDSK
jgi:hypothetical protein